MVTETLFTIFLHNPVIIQQLTHSEIIHQETSRAGEVSVSSNSPMVWTLSWQTGGHLDMRLQNHRMVWTGRQLVDHLLPTPLPWEGTPSTRPGCSKPHPTWHSALPGRGHFLFCRCSPKTEASYRQQRLHWPTWEHTDGSQQKCSGQTRQWKYFQPCSAFITALLKIKKRLHCLLQALLLAELEHLLRECPRAQ